MGLGLMFVSEQTPVPCAGKLGLASFPGKSLMKILVATDGSKAAMKAMKYAMDLVPLLHPAPSTITLITVHDDTALRHAATSMEKEDLEDLEDYLRELSEEQLAPARKLLNESGIRHEIEIGLGRVAQTIVAFADDGDFEIIILGSRGLGAVPDMAMGSVAQGVVATACQPVMLVK